VESSFYKWWTNLKRAIQLRHQHPGKNSAENPISRNILCSYSLKNSEKINVIFCEPRQSSSKASGHSGIALAGPGLIGVTIFGVGGTVPPTFWACDRKNNSDFPSSSAHVSPYNIQENVWRLGLRPRDRVDLHRRIQKNYTCEYIGEYMGLGA